MKARLSEIPEGEREKIFDIESNILPILRASGINIKKQDIIDEILKDLEQFVVTYRDGAKIKGIFRYSFQNDHIFIKSLFVNPTHRGPKAIMGLGMEIYQALREERIDDIRSTVQISNKQSMRLHKRLGFTTLKVNPKAVHFQINRKDLLERLCGLFSISS